MISLSIYAYVYAPAQCMKYSFSLSPHQAAYEDCGVGEGPVEPRRFLVGVHFCGVF